MFAGMALFEMQVGLQDGQSRGIPELQRHCPNWKIIRFVPSFVTYMLKTNLNENSIINDIFCGGMTYMR